MSTTLTSTNMGMPVPVPGQDPGPQYAVDIDNCFAIIDGHNHSAGSGVPITPAGLNITSDLSFLGNNATVLRSVRFSPQSAVLSTATDIGCLYEVTNDLYYNDGLGNQVRITQGGAVAGASGTITGLPSGTASAAFASSTFTFQSATNTAASLDGRNLILRNSTASSKGLTLSPPAAMGANYGLVLPALPSVTNLMTLDNAGNITAAVNVDSTTIVLSANTLSVPAGGIGTTQLAAASVTQAKRAALGQQTSSSCGTVALVSSPTAITNLTVTITTTGRPVYIGMMSDGGSSQAYFEMISAATSAGLISWYIDRDAATAIIARSDWQLQFPSGNGLIERLPISTWVIDVPSAGAHTYIVKASIPGTQVTSASINNVKLIAYEL